MVQVLGKYMILEYLDLRAGVLSQLASLLVYKDQASTHRGTSATAKCSTWRVRRYTSKWG